MEIRRFKTGETSVGDTFSFKERDMKLITGVYENRKMSGGFLQFLRQEKTPFVMTKERGDFPVFFFEEDFPDWGLDYVTAGGVAFVSSADKHTFDFESGYLTKANLEYADFSFCGEGKARIVSLVSIFEGEGIGKLTTHENRAIRDNRYPGFYPVIIKKEIGKGTLFYTGIPMAEILTAEGSTLRNTTDLFDFDERIVSTDKEKIESALRHIIRLCFKTANLPYVRLGYYPDGAENIFAYRIDGDGMSEPGTSDLIEAAKIADCPFTVYMSGEHNVGNELYIENMKRTAEGNEIACHNYIHNAMDSLEENLESLDKFDEWMESIGLPFERVFCAPRGMYGVNMAKALSLRGYRHSSDFGFKNGGLPFYPYLDGEQIGPLQVPVDGFNICRLWVSCRERGVERTSAEEILKLYKISMDDKLKKGIPLIYFCHPNYFGEISLDIYPDMVEYARANGAVPTTMTIYGDFWIKRDAVEYSAEYTGGEVRITGDIPESVSVIIE